MNVVSLLYKIAKSSKTKTAVIENDIKEISYQELWNTIDRLSSAFRNIGIRQNDRVVIALPNSPDFFHCFFSLLKINATAVPLSTNLTPYELKSIFRNLNPYAIICTLTLLNKVARDQPNLLDNKIIIGIKSGRSLGILNKCKKFHDLRDLYEERYAPSDIVTSDERLATINYTYRGFGYPLGAMLSHGNYTQGTAFYIERTELSENDNVLSLLPPYHVFPLVGSIIAPLSVGATVIIGDGLLISHILNMIQKYKVSILLAVPSLYYLLVKYSNRSRYDISSLKYCITGGDYMSREFQDEIRHKLGADVLQGYGLTECLPVTCNPPSKNKSGSLGPSGRADVKLKVINEYGEVKRTGEAGEILVKSPSLMAGYFNQKSDTGRVLKNGWFHTGDYGYLDEDNYLYFAGRKKDIAKVGGNMVDLKEVKDVLLSHPSVFNAFVYPEKNDLWGHVMVAEVESHKNGEVTEAEIRSFCARRLSRHKIPREIRFRTGVS